MSWRRSIAPSVLAAVVTAAAAAHAANDPTSREALLLHTCKGGDEAGAACQEPEHCSSGNCRLVVLRKTDVEVTVVAHDEVTDFDGQGLAGNTPVLAATIVLELKGKVLLARTFQHLAGTTLSALIASLGIGPGPFGSNLPLAEGSVANLLDPTSIENSLIFQRVGLGFGESLHDLLDVGDDEVLAIVKVKSNELADHTSDALATVVRVKLQIGVVKPAL